MPIAATSLVLSTEALNIHLEAGSKLDKMCLTKSSEVILQEGVADEHPDNYCQLVNHVGSDWHLDGIKVCLERPKELFFGFVESYRDSAILGLQAYHVD